VERLAPAILFACDAATCLFLAFLLVTVPRENQYANRLLAASMLFSGISICDVVLGSILRANGMSIWMDFVLIWFAPFIFPPIFFYARALTDPLFRVKGRHIIHFTLGIVNLLLDLGLFVWHRGDEAVLTAFLQTNRSIHLVYAVLDYGVLLQGLLYLIAMFWLLRRHDRVIKQFSAETDTVNLRWLFRFSVVIMGLWGIWAAATVDESLWGSIFTPLGFIGLYYYLGYNALRQRAVFQGIQEADKPFLDTLIHEIPPPAGEKPRADPARLQPLQEALLQLVETQKPYLDNELTLPKLAKLLGTSTNQLSQVLNEGLNENFYQFINRLRVEEGKRLLLDGARSHLTLEAIGYEAGFNSKTTFNTTFKKLTALSPSEFQKQGLGTVKK